MHDTTGTYLASDAMNTPTENITHTTKHVRFAEFFCGIGLIREAVEPLGWECVFANDINTNKTIIYEQRFGREHLTVDDIYNLTTEHIPTEVDAMTASFPCVDLSLAGNRAGLAGTQSGTIWPFMDLLTEQCQHRTPPSYLLLENVVGFLTSKGGQDLKAVCERVASLGYKIDILLVDARWFVPQSRPRVFVAGIQPEHLPAGTSEADIMQPSKVRPFGIRAFQSTYPGLPFVDLPVPAPPDGTSLTLLSVLEILDPGDRRWWPDSKTNKLIDEMTARNRTRVNILTSGQKGGVAAMYRRTRNGRTVGEVRDDMIAGCLRPPRGGSSVQFLMDCRSGRPRVRPLTGVEYGRLQGTVGFPVNVSDRQAQIGYGDAVCVPAVRWLIQNIFG